MFLGARLARDSSSGFFLALLKSIDTDLQVPEYNVSENKRRTDHLRVKQASWLLGWIDSCHLAGSGVLGEENVTVGQCARNEDQLSLA